MAPPTTPTCTSLAEAEVLHIFFSLSQKSDAFYYKRQNSGSLHFNINTVCINSSSRWYIKVFHNTWSSWRSLCIWIWAVDEWGPCLAEACRWWWHRLLMFVCKAQTVQWVFCLLVCPGPSSGTLKEYNGSPAELHTSQLSLMMSQKYRVWHISFDMGFVCDITASWRQLMTKSF